AGNCPPRCHVPSSTSARTHGSPYGAACAFGDGTTNVCGTLRRYGGVTVTTARQRSARYNRAFMEPWRTAIAASDATNIWIRGHPVTSLMRRATFTDAIVLLHLGRLPSAGERRLLDAILIGVADHGAESPSCTAARVAASGNRSSISSAVAAGVLAIGDEH